MHTPQLERIWSKQERESFNVQHVDGSFKAALLADFSCTAVMSCLEWPSSPLSLPRPQHCVQRL